MQHSQGADRWPLTALVVEDDLTTSMVLAYQLELYFSKVVTAANGEEGLSLFMQLQPDIVLTDNVMPVMNGIDMISEIRKLNPDVPVILITLSVDSDLLIKAINVNVTQFLPKPVDITLLRRIMDSEVKRLQSRQLNDTIREQELELLKYRERYHSQQQEIAFDKQLHIIRNDHPCHPFACHRRINTQEKWVCEATYLPLDILSGDSYSIRRASDGSLFLFIIDAMGKGVSASITSVLSTSYLNDILDRSLITREFNFRSCIDSYMRFIRNQLLDEEIVSVIFIHLSATETSLDVASFSMPPLLLLDNENRVCRINSNNPPISKHPHNYAISRHQLDHIRGILVYSDGLNEAITSDGGLYCEQLESDFATSFGSRQLWRRFRKATSLPDDDVTMIAISTFNYSFDSEIRLNIPSRISAIEQACGQLEKYLNDSGVASPVKLEESSVVIREILMNAYEHGSLGIGANLKNRLLQNDSYFEYILEKEKNINLHISVIFRLGRDMGKRLFYLDVKDRGRGFKAAECMAPRPDTLLPSGRGLHIIGMYTDRLYFCSKGKRITAVKFIEEENDNGTYQNQCERDNDSGEYQNNG